MSDRDAAVVSVELVKHLMTSLAPSSERARIIKGFVIGCTERVSERITDGASRRLTKPTITGR